MVPDNKGKNAYGLIDKIQTYVMAKGQAFFSLWYAVLASFIYSLIYLGKVKRKACAVIYDQIILEFPLP